MSGRRSVVSGQKETPSPKDVLKVIDAVRRLTPMMPEICNNGSCYRLYELLAVVFPDAEPYWDSLYHVATRIDGRFYDINGLIRYATGDFVLMTPSERRRQANHVAVIRVEAVAEDENENDR